MGKEVLEIFLEFMQEKYGFLSEDTINYIKGLKMANLKINYAYLLELFESEKMLENIQAHCKRDLKNTSSLNVDERIKYDIKIVLKYYPRFSKYKSLKKNPLHGITPEHRKVSECTNLYKKLNRGNMDLIEEKKSKYDDFLL